MIARDKVLHAAMGVAVVLGVLLLLLIAKHNTGAALAAATTLVGVAYEGQQKFRGEGEVSLLDAVATAAPGIRGPRSRGLRRAGGCSG